MLKSLVIASGAVVCLVAAPASAAPDQPQRIERRIEVSTAGLDLASARDARIMARRIHFAASQVCGPGDGTLLHRTSREYRACLDAATDGALARLDAPLVTAASGRSVNVTLARAGAD